MLTKIDSKIGVIIGISVFAGLAGGFGYWEYQQVAELQQEKSGLWTKIGELNSSVEGWKAAHHEKELLINSLIDEKNSLYAKNSDLQRQIDTLYSKNSNLHTEINSLSNQAELYKQQTAEQQAIIKQQQQQAAEAAKKQQELEQQAQLQAQQAQLQTQKDQIVSMAQTNSFVRGLITGHLNFYIPPVPNFADTSVPAAVDGTAKALEGYSFYGVVLHRVDDSKQADIIVQWVKNFGTDRSGQEVSGQVIEVGLGWDTCYGKWEPFNGYSVGKILWHEMGHALGFNHSNDPNNIMYAGGVGEKFSVDLNERYFLANGDGRTIPFCGSGTYDFNVSNDNQYVGFNVYVVPPNTNPNDVITGKAPYYVSCSTNNKVSYSGSCTVDGGSYLLVYNPYLLLGGNNMNVNVKIIDGNPDKVPNFQWDMNAFPYKADWINYVWRMFHS